MNIDIEKLQLCLGIMSGRRYTNSLTSDELMTLGWNRNYHPVTNEAMELAEDYYRCVFVSLAELANATSARVEQVGQETTAVANEVTLMSGNLSTLQLKVDSGIDPAI